MPPSPIEIGLNQNFGLCWQKGSCPPINQLTLKHGRPRLLILANKRDSSSFPPSSSLLLLVPPSNTRIFGGLFWSSFNKICNFFHSFLIYLSSTVKIGSRWNVIKRARPILKFFCELNNFSAIFWLKCLALRNLIYTNPSLKTSS